MSGKDLVNASTSRKTEEPSILDIIHDEYNRLPKKDRTLLTYGSVYLGLNGSFAGLLANRFVRRVLHVTQARFVSSLTIASLPLLTTVVLYEAAVSQPLFTGELDCSVCAVTRGGLIGSLAGGLYPILLAIPVNGGLAVKYQTSPMPTRGNIMRFCVTVSKPVLRQISFVLILQAMFGGYIGWRHFSLYEKMFYMPKTDPDDSIAREIV